MLDLSDTDAKIWIAMIAGAVSLVVAVIGAGTSWFTQRHVQRQQRDLTHVEAQLQLQLKRFEAEHAEQRAVRDAFRDYEYEARKRLYHECGPILFQLVEHARNAVARIEGLARTAAQGNLHGPGSWMSPGRYYRLSTYYRLLAPYAAYKLLQRRLTLVDLSLDQHMYYQYILARQASQTLTDDFELARSIEPALRYDPHAADAEKRWATDPAAYWQQGIPAGILDNAVEALLVTEKEVPPRLVTYSEFETLQHDDTPLARAFKRVDYLFDRFHPGARPVLWRVLLANAYIHRALIASADRGAAVEASLFLWPAEARAAYDWRAETDEVPDEAVLVAPFEAVEAYLRRKMQPVLATVRAQRGP